MLTRRVIPSLLLKGGRLVKGRRFGNFEDAGLPHTTARAHNAQGADELLIVDIDASAEGRSPDYDTVRKVALECFMPLTVGGGIVSVDVARRCMDAGADKLVINTPALDRPDLIGELARVYGAQAVVLSVDVVRAGGSWRLYDHRRHDIAASDRDPFEWMREAVERGAGEVRLCSVDREGSRDGFDLDLLRHALAAVSVPMLMEGGAGSFDHIHDLFEHGASGACLGTILVFADANIVKIKRYLAAAGTCVRG